MGNQQAMNGGNAYVGIYTFIDSTLSAVNMGFEYIMTQYPALEVGGRYAFSMHVSLADGSGYATDGLGALFTTYASPDSLADYTCLNAVPQIDFANYGYIADTGTWVTLADTFIADSAFEYVIIGNFKDSAHQLVHPVGYTPPLAFFGAYEAYYFIDSVSLFKLPPSGIIQISSASVNMKVAPNPASATINFSFDNPGGELYSLTVFDLKGMVVKKFNNITAGTVKMERENIPSGLYCYQLRNHEQVLANGTVVLQ
jgi:hypothetical protein